MFLKADKSLALFLRIHYDSQMWGAGTITRTLL